MLMQVLLSTHLMLYLAHFLFHILILLQAHLATRQSLPLRMMETLKKKRFLLAKKILLGLPRDNEETAAIRSKLLEYGKAHDDIYSISFLTKIEEDTKVVRHLVVLEFPKEYTPENMKPHMEAIYHELAPVVNEIKQIEYAIKGKIPAIDNVVAEHALQMVVYTK